MYFSAHSKKDIKHTYLFCLYILNISLCTSILSLSLSLLDFFKMYFHKPAKQYQYLFEFYCHYVDWYSMVNNSNLHCSTNGSLLKHGSFAHIFFHRLKSLRENKGRTTVFFKVKSFCRAFSSHTHGKQSLSCATADTRQTKATDDVPRWR
jgi:hypothetical protein